MPNQEKTIKVLKKREVLKNDLALGIAGELTNIEEKVDNLTDKVIEQENVPTVKVEGISLITLKGDIGEKGDTGEKGEQGEPGKDGIDGKNGTNGRDGKNGNDGKNGKNGLDGLDGKNGLDGKDGSPDTAEDIVAKINELPTDEDDFKIDAKHIKNLPKVENRPNAIGVSNKYLDQLLDVDLTGVTKTDGKYVLGSGGGSGVQSIVAGTNITVDDTDPANPIVASLSDRYKTTSTTSQAIVSTGTLTFTVDADLAYTPQQDIIIAYDSSNHMHGTVTSYSGTSLVVDIQHKTGAGTYASWVINLDAISATPVSVTDSATIDLTLTGQDITASIVAGSIDETHLDVSVNASLDLADTAVQPAGLTNYFNKSVDDTDDITEGATKKFNVTHTGEVTGATTLTVDKTAITNKTNVTAAVGDSVLISDVSDSGNLKKVTVQSIVDLASGGATDISVRVYQSSGQTLGTSLTVINFNSESYDTDTMHDNSTNNSRITFTTAGKYTVSGIVNTDANAIIFSAILLNGTTTIAAIGAGNAGPSTANGNYLSTDYVFGAGDYVELLGCFGVAQTTKSGIGGTQFLAKKLF